MSVVDFDYDAAEPSTETIRSALHRLHRRAGLEKGIKLISDCHAGCMAKSCELREYFKGLRRLGREIACSSRITRSLQRLERKRRHKVNMQAFG